MIDRLDKDVLVRRIGQDSRVLTASDGERAILAKLIYYSGIEIGSSDVLSDIEAALRPGNRGTVILVKVQLSTTSSTHGSIMIYLNHECTLSDIVWIKSACKGSF